MNIDNFVEFCFKVLNTIGNNLFLCDTKWKDIIDNISPKDWRNFLINLSTSIRFTNDENITNNSLFNSDTTFYIDNIKVRIQNDNLIVSDDFVEEYIEISPYSFLYQNLSLNTLCSNINKESDKLINTLLPVKMDLKTTSTCFNINNFKRNC